MIYCLHLLYKNIITIAYKLYKKQQFFDEQHPIRKEGYLASALKTLTVIACTYTLLSSEHHKNQKEPDSWGDFLNHFFFDLNQDLLTPCVMRPLGYVYEALPSPLTYTLTSVSRLLMVPTYTVHHMLQGNPHKGCATLYGGILNSVFGCFGLIRVDQAYNTPITETGLEDTLKSYGITSSTVVVLPFLGPAPLLSFLGGSIDGMTSTIMMLPWFGRYTISTWNTWSTYQKNTPTFYKLIKTAYNPYQSMYRILNNKHPSSPNNTIDEDERP